MSSDDGTVAAMLSRLEDGLERRWMSPYSYPDDTCEKLCRDSLDFLQIYQKAYPNLSASPVVASIEKNALSNKSH
jgi:hypothetical protein